MNVHYSDRPSEGFDLAIFGGPALFRAGTPIALSPFQEALLGILGTHAGREVPRMRLAELLWEPADEAAVRRRLSQLVYKIRQATGSAILIRTRGDQLAVDTERARVDLVTFHDMLRQGEVRETATLLARGLLSNASHPMTEAYRDWLDAKRLRLRAELREKAAGIWATASATAQWRMADEAAEVLLELSPDDEECLRKVLHARAMSGRPDAAEALFHAFAERMRARAGTRWSPGEETVRLVDQVRAIDRSGPVQLAIAVAQEREPALIGRDEELARLSRTLGSVPDEELRIVVVTGEAGMGKTRLVRDGLRPAPLEGIRVLSGQFAEFERDIPLNSLLEALTTPAVREALGRLGEPWRTVVLALLPEFHEGPEPLPEVPYVQPGELPRRLFEAMRLLFMQIVEPAPVVLFLDDLQWADETTIAALEYLRRRWEGGRLTIVFTLRPEALDPASRIGRFVADLRTRQGIERIELTELTPGDGEALVREVAEHALTAKEQMALASLGGQVPFFVIELVQEHVAGRLPPQPLHGDHMPIPLSIQQVLEQRLTNLSPPADLVLKALAVYGHPAGVQELTRLAEIPAETCVAALEQLQTFRLVHWLEGGVFLRHQLIRHTVYAGTGEASRRWLHGKVAEYLLLQSPHPVDQLALHYHRAGMKSQALEFALEAADKAESGGGVPEARGYLGIARASTDEPIQSANIIGKLAHLHYLHRDFAEAGPLLTVAAGMFREQGRVAEALSAETERVDTLSQQESVPRGPLEELGRIKEEAKKHDCWEVVAKALDVEVRIHGRVGNVTEAAATLLEVQTCLRQKSPSAQCIALCSLALGIFYGPAEIALEAARLAVVVARKHQLNAELLLAQNRLMLVLILQGLVNTEEAQLLHLQALQTATRSGDLFSKFNLHANRGVWLLDTGWYDEASVAFREAALVIGDSEARAARRMLAYNLGELSYQNNDVDMAIRYMEDARALLDRAPSIPVLSTLHAGLGLCALYRGRLREAQGYETLLPPDPAFWFFEPSTVSIFRAKLLARRGDHQGATDYLEDTARGIAGRFVTSWSKLKVEQLRISAKHDPPRARMIAEELRPLAVRLKLTQRTQDIDSLCGRLSLSE